MTTETHVMEILERANPVPPGELVDVPVGVTRYLETVLQQRSEPMTVIDPTPTRIPGQPPRRRWTLVAVAASVAAIVVASIALIVATRDDDTTVADQPEPTVPQTTVPPTTAPAPTTAAATAGGAAQTVVDEFFAAYNSGGTDDVLSLMTNEIIATEQYDFGIPNPEDDPLQRNDIELRFAWNHAQGEVWTEPTCELAPEQLPAGTTLRCDWETLDAVVQAVDGAPIPTTALIVVSDDRIAGLHLAYQSPDFSALGRPFGSWMETNHPDVEGADCCAGDDVEESIQRGQLRAQWAQEWAAYLATYDCSPTAICTIPVEEWVAEYDTQCVPLASTDPLDDLVARMSELPPSATEPLARDRLMRADRELLGDPTDERITDLQQQRLESMVELGIDGRCHPVIG